jgi:hypothetical protein
VEKNEKKLAFWKGSCLSLAGRTTLINLSLSSSFIYHTSIYLLPKTIVDSLDKTEKEIFLARRKYHRVRWDVICRSKLNGGLVIEDILK